MDRHVSSLFQAPHWRWALAEELTENSERSCRRNDDLAVKSAKRFWLSWVNCHCQGDRDILAARMPMTYQAWSLYSDPQGVSRNAVEARILAAEAPDAIAKKSGTIPAVIQVYEQLFFDVRTRLGSFDYILNQVIGPRWRVGDSDWSYDLIWKFFGYFGGVSVLDAIMGSYVPARPASLEKVEAFLSEDARAVVRAKMAIAARVLGAGDRRTASTLLTSHPDLLGMKNEEADSFRDRMHRHINAMLQEIPWLVGKDAETRLPPELAEHHRGAAELRDDEMHRVATGQEPPDLKELRKLTIPPARPSTGKATK